VAWRRLRGIKPSMNDARSALVLFSGGQDSTTCLAWALERFAHVETVALTTASGTESSWINDLWCWKRSAAGFPTGQAGSGRTISSTWRAGPDQRDVTHRDVAFEMEKDGLPNTFVPGRNLLFFTFAAAIAWRRAIADLVGGCARRTSRAIPTAATTPSRRCRSH